MAADGAIAPLLSQLSLPEQSRKQLDFCAGRKPAQVAAWVDELPRTRVNYTGGLLYRALPEIEQLKTDPATRLEMLDLLRPAVHESIESLSRRFLNQPLILPPPARKAATIAQALQKHLSNGYMVALREACQANQKSKPLLARACHRAITGLGLLLLRNHQVYTQVPGRVWRELHLLYQLAGELGIDQLKVTDPLPDHRGVTTIEQAYTRVLLLACARPNQLRQSEILRTYQLLEVLSARAAPSLGVDNDTLFAVDLDGSAPPRYRSQLSERGGLLMGLDTRGVLAGLAELAGDEQLPAPLLAHLRQAWGSEVRRRDERRANDATVEVAVGLSALHYHLSGVSFADFLSGMAGDLPSDDDFRRLFREEAGRGGDGEDEEIDYGLLEDPSEAAPEPSTEHYPLHRVALVDSGPGGYCLEWRETIPGQARAGELIGLRETRRDQWATGVIRWVQQTRQGTQMGVQILARRAAPVGVAVVHNTGGFSEYLRGLEITEERDPTLVTNAISFREYGRVRVLRPDQDGPRENGAQLTQQLFATGAAAQFQFHDLAE